MAASLACSFATLCCVALWGFTGTSDGTYIPPPHSTTKPGFPVPMDTDNPGVRKAARFGVYQYNNSSNDLFLFKEWQINKAMVQIVRGLKYMLHVEIGRTVCEKKEHCSLDSCHFQKKKKLQQMLFFSCPNMAHDAENKQQPAELCHPFPFYLQMLKCYFEVWIVPWLQKAHVPVALCR